MADGIFTPLSGSIGINSNKKFQLWAIAKSSFRGNDDTKVPSVSVQLPGMSASIHIVFWSDLRHHTYNASFPDTSIAAFDGKIMIYNTGDTQSLSQVISSNSRMTFNANSIDFYNYGRYSYVKLYVSGISIEA